MRRQPVIWAALRFFRTLINALPHKTAVALGARLGSVVRVFSAQRVDKAAARCSRILMTDRGEAEGIINRAYSNFGRALVEFLRLPAMYERLDDLVTLKGEEHLRDAFKLGRGVIFLSAHIGNWEYGAALMARHGFPMNAIGAEQRDSRITEAIADARRRAGVKPVGKGLDLKAAIHCLKKGEVLAVLLDQDAREAGLVSSFLGVPASTPHGPLRMAHKFGAPVIPAHIVRNPDGLTFTMTIEPALSSPDGRPFGEDLQQAVDACNEAISAWIRRDPDQWMWMYPRWATTTGDR